MKIQDLDFIEIKTKRSPTSNALQSITRQKLKPYYNTVYQLLQLKHPRQKTFQEVQLQIQQKVIKNMPRIVFDRKIGQQTLQFKIVKPLQKKHFSNQTKSSSIKKCRSVQKYFSLTKEQIQKHEQKDLLSKRFDTFRKLSKTFSESILPNKKKYNTLQKWHTIVDNHYQGLQLQPRFLGGDENDQNLIIKKKQNRFKLQANLYKWVQNTLISNDSEHVSIARQQKSKYFRQKGAVLAAYKGVNQQQVKQCKQIIQQDKDLINFSLSHTIATTNVTQVKSLYQKTRGKLTNLIDQYKTTRSNSPVRHPSRLTRSLQRSPKRKLTQCSTDYKQYEKFKNSKDQNPETYKIGDRHSNFRSSKQKFGMLTRLKQHQKKKYTAKCMNVNMHKKLFLKQK